MTSVALKRKLVNQLRIVTRTLSYLNILKKSGLFIPIPLSIPGVLFFVVPKMAKKDEIFTPLGKHISFPAQEVSYYFQIRKNQFVHFYTGFVFFLFQFN